MYDIVENSREDFPSKDESTMAEDISEHSLENFPSKEHEAEPESSTTPKEETPEESPAKKTWSKLRAIVKNSSNSSSNLRRSSLTEPEGNFLKMLNTSKSNRQLSSSCSSLPNFADVVAGAVARDRLRKSLQTSLEKLTIDEAKFLKDIVENEDVTKQQLERADYVLRTDPLYRLPGHDDEESDDEGAELPEISEHGELDVSIEMNDGEIELMLSGVNMNDGALNASLSSLQPGSFSYKAWDLVQDQPPAFPILGMTDNIPERTRVLSPPMIDSLRNFLPHAVAEDHFWLRYSMGRDGASLDALYYSIRQSTRTLLAIETVNGEIFGAFVSSPWRDHRSFYGSCEAFLWRVKESRFMHSSSVEEQARLESNLQVFKWSQENRSVQMSDRTKLAIGGGYPEEDPDKEEEVGEDWGLGIALGHDLFQGTSSPCITFRSPALSQQSPKGRVFEVSNLEVWSFTPCQTVKEAEHLELGRMFVLSHFTGH